MAVIRALAVRNMFPLSNELKFRRTSRRSAIEPKLCRFSGWRLDFDSQPVRTLPRVTHVDDLRYFDIKFVVNIVASMFLGRYDVLRIIRRVVPGETPRAKACAWARGVGVIAAFARFNGSNRDPVSPQPAACAGRSKSIGGACESSYQWSGSYAERRVAQYLRVLGRD